MDKNVLLQADIQAFIKAHENDDLQELMLQKEKYPSVPMMDIINQISSRRKAEKKLPSWHQSIGILYPDSVSLEQSSSELAAEYKASLFSGKYALDLTCGFGIDSFYFAKRFKKVISVEENTELAEITKHNFKALELKNISVKSVSAEAFIQNNDQYFDLIYIDPDRRPGNKRVMGFEDSQPNILTLLPKLIKIADHILIKASPMMDITHGLRQLKKAYMVIVVAIENEVKELLFWLDKSKLGNTNIRCINIAKNGDQILEFDVCKDQQEKCALGKVSEYLYEPNAAIMKVGSFNILCKYYNITKLHPNTHLFTSDKIKASFPGRIFKIKSTVNYRKKEVLPLLVGNKTNISTRNFIDSPEQVKKKLGLEDGGDQYLFCFRDWENMLRIAICEKIDFS